MLAAVPEPLEPLDAVMLDGFLCGVIVQPRADRADEWLPFVFDAGGHRWGEAEPGPEQHACPRADPAPACGAQPLDRRIRRLRSVRARAAARRGGERRPSRRGRSVATRRSIRIRDDLLALGLGLRSGAAAAARSSTSWRTARSTTALARLLRFLPEDGEGEDDRRRLSARASVASLDAAIGAVVAAVADLYDITTPLRYKVEALRRDAPKVGRNDPCPCGSGRKFKQCHGAASAAAR